MANCKGTSKLITTDAPDSRYIMCTHGYETASEVVRIDSIWKSNV